jgi:lysophospholipase L1-like esterase
VSRSGTITCTLLCIACAAAWGWQLASQPIEVGQFESAVRAYDIADRRNPPPQEGIVCLGSSSIGGWQETVAADLDPLKVVTRGLPGSTMADAVRYADRLVVRYRPRAVVLYNGDNDIANGSTPAQVRDAFKAFTAAVHAKLPDTRVYVISIKPSPGRWHLWPRMARTNALLRDACSADKRLAYIDVASRMLDGRGRCREELYRPDRIHMNAKGYHVWGETLRPVLLNNHHRKLAGAASVAARPVAKAEQAIDQPEFH